MPPPPEDGTGPRLPDAFAEPGRFPLVYPLMQPMDGSGAPVRMAGSERRHARTTLCNAFYKPVSKCFLVRSPASGDPGAPP